MKKTGEKDFNVPEYVSGDIKLMDINQVKPVVIDQVEPIVIRFDFFRQGSTGAFDRRVLFKKPGLFQRIDRQAIMSEVHFRCAEIAEDYINKNVVLEIYLSRQDIARKERLRYIQESYHALATLFYEAGIKYQVIFEPLGTSLNERVFSF
jgi:hypothetical protein